MGHTSPTDRIFCSRHEAILNATKHHHIHNIHCLREAKKLLKTKILKGSVVIKLKKKIMQPMHSPYCQKLCRKFVTSTTAMPIQTGLMPIPTSSVVATYPYQQNYNYSITMNDWSHRQCIHTAPIYTMRPVPIIIPSSSPIFTQFSPILGPAVQPMLSPILPQPYVQEHVANISNYYNYSTEIFENVADISNEQTFYVEEEIVSPADINTLNNVLNRSIEYTSNYTDIESYLTLPKGLFPKPSMLAIDPNPIIDEFCKMPNIQRHASWILDLEFGIPKTPITRPIPTYNVKFNSIHCKNAPDAIHPGFESCDPNFKKAMLFYYDCVVSAWYKGYMIMHCDRSVENFQSWLHRPMQALGMCWA